MDHLEKDEKEATDFELCYGSIQFRYGWALIRGQKDVSRGIELLEQADRRLIDNFDLKLKLAQILFQENQDFVRAQKYLNLALKINSNDFEAFLLQCKLLFRDKKFAECSDCANNLIKSFSDQTDSKFKASVYFIAGQAQQEQKNFKQSL